MEEVEIEFFSNENLSLRKSSFNVYWVYLYLTKNWFHVEMNFLENKAAPFEESYSTISTYLYTVRSIRSCP